MKPYLNSESKQLTEHLKIRKEKGHKKTSVYFEIERPKNATRVWLSYDINDDDAPANCRSNLETWLNSLESESFGESVASFLIKNKCIKNNKKMAEWLVPRLCEAGVLSTKDKIIDEKPYLETKGVSLYIIYRSRENGPATKENQYSNHFVLIQNTKVAHLGGY